MTSVGILLENREAKPQIIRGFKESLALVSPPAKQIVPCNAACKKFYFGSVDNKIRRRKEVVEMLLVHVSLVLRICQETFPLSLQPEESFLPIG